MNDNGPPCPVCGNQQKPKTITWRMDPKTGKEVHERMNIIQGCFLGIGILLGMALVSACVIAIILPAIFGAHAQGEQLPLLEGFIEAVVLLSAITLPVLIPIIFYIRSWVIYHRSIIAVDFTCGNGHRWTVPGTNQSLPSKDQGEGVTERKGGAHLSAGDRVYPTVAGYPGYEKAIPVYFSSSPQAVPLTRATSDTPAAIPVYFTDSNHPGAIPVRWGSG